MPTFEIVAPDGRKFEVTGPEGSTAEQALAQVQAQYKPQVQTPEKPTVLGTAKSLLQDALGTSAKTVLGLKGGASDVLSGPSELMDKAAYNTGGVVTDMAAKVLPPEVAAGAGFAANVGVQAIPMLLGGAIGQKASPGFEYAAKRSMQSALKPTIADLRTGNAAKAIDTMLSEGVNVSSGGAAKLRSKIGDLNNEVMQAIANSPATVDKYAAARTMRDLIQDFTKQVNPKSDITAIRSAWQEFIDHPLLKGKTDIPVQLAQELKQGTYRALGSKPYGELQGAATEAQKALARGLKNEISAAVPGVAKLNAQESQLINALNVAERRVLMSANNNPAGLALLAQNPSQMAAFMADKSDLFKSIVARMLYSGREAIPRTAGQVVGAGVGAYSGQD
jgi:hypothetical protein